MDAVAFPAMPAEPDKAPRSVSSLAAGTSRASPSIVDIPNVADIPESRASLLPEHRNETSWLQL